MFKTNVRQRLLLALVVSALAASTSASAATLAELISAVNFADTVSAIFSIGVLIIGVDLAQLGYQKIRRLVKGSH